jgi:hypothetical protein
MAFFFDATVFPAVGFLVAVRLGEATLRFAVAFLATAFFAAVFFAVAFLATRFFATRCLAAVRPRDFAAPLPAAGLRGAAFFLTVATRDFCQ